MLNSCLPSRRNLERLMTSRYYVKVLTLPFGMSIKATNKGAAVKDSRLKLFIKGKSQMLMSPPRRFCRYAQ